MASTVAENDEQSNEVKLLSAKEVARILKISLQSVYNLANEGKLGHYKVGKRTYRFTWEWLRSYLNRNKVQAEVKKTIDERNRLN